MPPMSLMSFRHFIQFAPIVLCHLIVGSAVPYDLHLVKQVLCYFRMLTPNLCHEYEQTGTISSQQRLQLASGCTLDLSLAHLPLLLYELYRDSVRKTLAQQDGFIVPREELVYTITAGTIPFQYCFAIGSMVCSWDCHSGGINVHRIDGQLLFEQCRNLLINEGHLFQSMSDVYSVAQREKWPSWELVSLPASDQEAQL